MARTMDRATSTPFAEALAFNNIIINGGMDVSQENGTTQITFTNNVGKYLLDQWSVFYNHTAATAVVKGQQVTPPGTPAFGVGLPNCLQVTATTALSSPATGDEVVLLQPLEGYRIAKLGFGNATNPQFVTVGFWAYATIAGTGTLSIRNGAANRSYVANFTISAALTWQYITVTIPVDATGTWPTTNVLAGYLGFCFVGGASLQGTNGAWQAGNLTATSATTNFFATSGNTVCITGVTMFPGTEAPTQARSPFAIRPFADELMACQRYWETNYPTGAALGSVQSVNIGTIVFQGPTGVVSAGAHLHFKVRKRATPTVVTYSPANGTINKARDNYNGADVTPTLTAIGDSSFSFNIVQTSANGMAPVTMWTADARM